MLSSLQLGWMVLIHYGQPWRPYMPLHNRTACVAIRSRGRRGPLMRVVDGQPEPTVYRVAIRRIRCSELGPIEGYRTVATKGAPCNAGVAIDGRLVIVPGGNLNKLPES